MQSFAIRSTRTEKKFTLASNDINRQLGTICLEHFPEWQVNLDEPAITFHVLVMKDKIHITHQDISGPGGLPVGTAGKLALLLSGGIDSPIAGYQMQRRGAHLLGVYFHSFPYTGDQALSKVKDLREVLEQFQNKLPLHIVHFTIIQEAIRDHCHPKYSVVLNRRMMMRIAENIALKNHALGLITGESLGQVASQTLENMHAVGQATSLQIYRPLIGVDKQDITTSARRLGTFEISSRPFEDCCTLFVDKHPVIRADLEFITEQEDKLDISKLIKEALEKTFLV
jgi:thiamine biosynthesis protein ThiI